MRPSAWVRPSHPYEVNSSDSHASETGKVLESGVPASQVEESASQESGQQEPKGNRNELA